MIVNKLKNIMKKYIHVDAEVNRNTGITKIVFSTYSSWHYQWRPDLEILDEDDEYILNYENTNWVKIEYTRRLRYKLKKYFKFSKNWYITSKEFFSYIKTNKKWANPIKNSVSGN